MKATQQVLPTTTGSTTLQTVHADQLRKITGAFGVANAEAVAKDNKLVRAVGVTRA